MDARQHGDRIFRDVPSDDCPRCPTAPIFDQAGDDDLGTNAFAEGLLCGIIISTSVWTVIIVTMVLL